MFRFKLSAALEQRRREEKQSSLIVARARNVSQALASERDVLSTELDRLGSRLSRWMIPNSDVYALSIETAIELGKHEGALALTATRTAWIVESHARITQALTAVDTDLAQARTVLVRAAAARRSLELLEQRQREEYRRRVARREAAELDEGNAFVGRQRR